MPKDTAASLYFNYETAERDPYAGNSRKERPVYDYFAGMDSIATPPPLKQPMDDCQRDSAGFPDQLLDQQASNGGHYKRPPRTVASPKLNRSETIGRNTWMAWCGGNEGFWDWLANENLGFIDLLKLLDSRRRFARFRDAGLINEPEMTQANLPPPGEFGLWLDRPEDDRIRHWRETYVRQTFEAIAQGRHKSQIGLSKGPANDPASQQNLYTGDPRDHAGEGYLYPSQYLIDGEGDSGSAAPYGGYDVSAASQVRRRYDEVIPPPDMYGIASGVIGLRLFPNPYFDADAQAKWDAQRYYEDESYFTDPRLIRPYRVGMSCAFCHASFHPLQPPRDLHNPEWENLSGNIGAQYLSMRATVGNLLEPDQFVYHLLDSQPRGTIDTSLIASDNINNPNTMNSVFGLKQRAILSLHNPRERLSVDSAMLPSLWVNPDPRAPADAEDRIPPELVAELQCLYPEDKHELLTETLAGSNDSNRRVPRILLDGSDSVGTFAALARVYLNIGSYWEQWNQIHQVVIGFEPQQPFKLTDCESNSVYWNATKKRVPGLRDYFLKITPTMPLLSAGSDARHHPVDEARLRDQASREDRDLSELLREERAQHVDVTKLKQGRRVFAENCLVCHSSIQPETAYLLMQYPMDENFKELIDRRNQVRLQAEVNGEFYEHDPAQWLGNPDYLRWALTVVEEPEFWTNNYLSTDYRVPVNLVGTNSARAMGTNAMTGHMWQDFSSESYRKLPSPGEIQYFNPYAGDLGEEDTYSPRHRTPEGAPPQGGGPGYYRVPTLISIWATAPLLHNNSLGLYNNDPSVNGRLAAFDDAIRKMLWPEKRLQSSSYNGATAARLKRDHGLIWRTTQPTYLSLDAKRVPYLAQRIAPLSKLHRKLPWLRFVYPLWLPTLILLAAALLILVVSNHRHRRVFGWLLLALSVLLWLGSWFARSHPGITGLGWIRSIYPYWLPLLLTVAVGVVLLLPLSRMWARRVGYLSLVLGLLIGLVVYFNAGKLGDVRIGPIPRGTPVNLLANFNSEAKFDTQLKSVHTVVSGLAEIESRDLDDAAAASLIREKVAPALMEVNKCPDFVMDRGHYFPWFDSMTDEDKNALIELLKTF